MFAEARLSRENFVASRAFVLSRRCRYGIGSHGKGRTIELKC